MQRPSDAAAAAAREFLTYAKSCPDVWITTGEKIAENFLRHEAGNR
ncbi:hypothetical protein ACVL92_008829 [Bradyrhizobium liaoningense]